MSSATRLVWAALWGLRVAGNGAASGAALGGKPGLLATWAFSEQPGREDQALSAIRTQG